jgi:hypothetical protein
MKWTTRATLEAFREAFHLSAGQLPEIIREWQETVDQDWLLAFAQQLEEDFRSIEIDTWDPGTRLAALGAQMALDRVDWKQVALRLVEYAEAGPWPPHEPVRCWCSKPLRAWPRTSQADAPVVVQGRTEAVAFFLSQGQQVD